MVVLPGSVLALGRYEVTLGEYRAFAAATRGGQAAGVAARTMATTRGGTRPLRKLIGIP